MKRLLIILLLLSSCSVAVRKPAHKPLHFFACSRWVDYNKDGIYDYNEFENIKNTFHAAENVLFVGFVSDLPLGTSLRFRLYAPDGSLAHEVEQPLLFRKTLIHTEYTAGALVSEKSAGIWEAVWDVDNEVVADIEVKFVY